MRARRLRRLSAADLPWLAEVIAHQRLESSEMRVDPVTPAADSAGDSAGDSVTDSVRGDSADEGRPVAGADPLAVAAPLAGADPLAGDGPACGEDPLWQDTAWAHAAMQRYGLCGVAATDADVLLGWLLVCPALHLPAQHPLARGGRTSSAAQLLQVQVQPAWQGIGVGRHLVQHVAAGLVRAQVQHLDAVGAPRAGDRTRPPVGWLAAVGFHELGPAPVRPDADASMRLDLAGTLRWRPRLGGSLSAALAGLIRPASAPWPASARSPQEWAAGTKGGWCGG